MHNAQRPLSGTSIAPTKKNFPSAQLFFPSTESNEDTFLTDILNGVETGAANITSADGNSLTVSQINAGVAIAKGVIPSPGSKVAILFSVGVFSSQVLNIGITPGLGGTGGLQFLGVTNNYQASDEVDLANTAGASTFGFSIEAHALVLDPGVLMEGHRVQTDNTYGINGSDNTSVPTITNISQTTAFGNAAAGGVITDLHGVALFYFDAVPDDLVVAMQWMKAEWIKGNKTFYPGWKDKI